MLHDRAFKTQVFRIHLVPGIDRPRWASSRILSLDEEVFLNLKCHSQSPFSKFFYSLYFHADRRAQLLRLPVFGMRLRALCAACQISVVIA